MKSALTRDPGRKAAQPQVMAASGAMARDPNPERIQRRIDFLKRTDPKSKEISRLEGRLAGAAPVDPGTADPADPAAPPSYDAVTGSANTALNTAFDQMAAQGPFNPTGLPDLNQDYGAQRMRAEQMAMESFNRNVEPLLQRQEADWRNRMAQEGVAPGSERWNKEYEQMQAAHNSQRQNAGTAAFQAGGAEQAQQYGQALSGRGQMFNEQFQGYQLPMAQIGALSPFYGAQTQFGLQNSAQNFQGNQAALDRDFQERMARLGNKFSLQQIAATPRGGGGGGGALSMNDRFALMDREFYNSLVLQGIQNGQPVQSPGAAGGFAQGVGVGIGAGLGAGLR